MGTAQVLELISAYTTYKLHSDEALQPACRGSRLAAALTTFFCAILLERQTGGQIAKHLLMDRPPTTAPALTKERLSAIVTEQGFGGVQHYTVPGMLNSTPPTLGNGTVHGIMHIFLKALKSLDGHIRVRGFFFFEFTVEPEHFKLNPGLRQLPAGNLPEVYKNFQVGIKSRLGDWEHNVSLETHSEYYPVLNLDFGQQPATDVLLFIRGWPRSISLATMLADPIVEQPASIRLSVQQLICYPFNLAADHLAKILAWKAEYNSLVGMDRIVIYVKPHDIPTYLQHPTIQKLVNQGTLAIVRWDLFSYMDDWPNFDHKVNWNHGVLSFWGTGIWLYIADLDEFPVTHGELFSDMLATGCMSAQHGCMLLPGHNVWTSSQADEEPRLWRDGSRNPLPLFNYSSLKKGMQKHLVDPNRAIGTMAHGSYLCVRHDTIIGTYNSTNLVPNCSERQICLELAEDCAWTAHVVNMWKLRRVREDAIPNNIWF